MKIVIARIRSYVIYQKPLNTVLDSFFENYVKWMQDNTQHDYNTYNVTFDGTMPKRTPETIKNADVIIIPSDSEFRYHGQLQMDPRDLEKSENHMKNIRPYFENKKVIIWRSDRGDSKELYETETLKNINLKSINVIDEIDFSGNIHGMKYHFLKKLTQQNLFEPSKDVDFGYWGKMKPAEKNEREKTLRKLYREENMSKVLVGGYPSGVVRNNKWIKDWNKLYPLLKNVRATICFNWLDSKATTARYIEALAMNIIPFVWKDYDSKNTFNIEANQRVNNFNELKTKIYELRHDKLRNTLLTSYKNNYKKVLLSEENYYQEFKKKMENCL